MDKHSHLKIGAGLYSFSAVDGAARDRHVEHSSLPHIGLTSKHNGEVCVDAFAVPKFRHGGRLLLGQAMGSAKRTTVFLQHARGPLVRGIWHKREWGPPAASSSEPQSAARRAKKRTPPTLIPLRKVGVVGHHKLLEL